MFYQQLAVPEQRRLGARFLSAEIYNNKGGISVCHKYCTTGGQTAPKCRRSLKSFLQDVSIFLRVNINEVVTLRLINGDNRDIKALDDAFAVSGLKDLAFNLAGTRSLPVALDSWPTYAKLISARERFIVFLDSGAAPSVYPYILSQNDHFIETARDDLKNCDAVPSGANAEGKMYMMNHNAEYSYDAGHCQKPSSPTFYTYYNRADPPPVGTAKVDIMQHANTCKKKFQKYPNVVWLNSINLPEKQLLSPDIGPFKAQERMNGLSDAIIDLGGLLA